MTNVQKSQIQEALLKTITDQALTQNQAAKMIGVSSAVLSNMLTGKEGSSKWDLIRSDKWRAAAEFAGVNDTQTTWSIRETRNLKLVVNLCEDSQKYSRFLAVAGYSGAGKTTALKYYQRKTPGVFYVLCTVTMGKKNFLDVILASMGKYVEGSIFNKVNEIVTFLRTIDKPLLILDDAGKLTDANLRLIQVIYDELENRTGIVLAGTEYLHNYILKMAAKDKYGFQELSRRIEFWQKMYAPTRGVIKAICEDNGIKDKKAQDFIHRVAKNYGSMKALITNALRMAKDEEVNVEMLAGLNIGNRHWEEM
jgi:DNA transposition AAA+ family ATPase